MHFNRDHNYYLFYVLVQTELKTCLEHKFKCNNKRCLNKMYILSAYNSVDKNYFKWYFNLIKNIFTRCNYYY